MTLIDLNLKNIANSVTSTLFIRKQNNFVLKGGNV